MAKAHSCPPERFTADHPVEGHKAEDALSQGEGSLAAREPFDGDLLDIRSPLASCMLTF